MRTFIKFITVFALVVIIFQAQNTNQKVYADTGDENQYSIAYVNSFSGDCQIKRSGQNQYEDIEDLYLPLYENDAVKTGSDGIVEIAFDDDTIVKVDSNSDMVILNLDRKPDWKQTIIELFTGKLFTNVNKLQQGDNFEIKTKMAMAAVKGTEFAVDAGVQFGEDSKVGVYGGNVAVSGLDERGNVVSQQMIPANQETTVNGKNKMVARPYQMQAHFLKYKQAMFDMKTRINYMRQLKKTGKLRAYQRQAKQKWIENIKQNMKNPPKTMSQAKRAKWQKILNRYNSNSVQKKPFSGPTMKKQEKKKNWWEKKKNER